MGWVEVGGAPPFASFRSLRAQLVFCLLLSLPQNTNTRSTQATHPPPYAMNQVSSGVVGGWARWRGCVPGLEGASKGRIVS